MQEEQLKTLIEKTLAEYPNLFLLSVEVKGNNQITIVIDGDKGVAVNDCMVVSRALEENLDREQEDFSLEVTSAGVSSPLQLPRQFKKNINRKVKVQTADETYEAKLVNADEQQISLTWKAREPKPVGKGKQTVTKELTLPYEDIVEAKVMITF